VDGVAVKRLLGSGAAGIAAIFVLGAIAIALRIPETAPGSGILALVGGALVALTAYVASGR
jgi:hypothetical protein